MFKNFKFTWANFKIDRKRAQRLCVAFIFLMLIGIFGYLLAYTRFLTLQSKTISLISLNKKLTAKLKNCRERLELCQDRFVKKVEIIPNSCGGYNFYVKGKPFLVKGVGYNPTPIGKGYDYELFSDETKPWLVDGKLMKEAGINCVRIYSTGSDLEKVKEFISDMYEKFGIYTLVSDWLGLWDYPRANYADQKFRERTKKRILGIVEALKNEEGLLMWILGNENNYTFSGRIGFWTSNEIEKLPEACDKQNKRAEIYYSFVNDLTLAIKKIDPLHPIALGNGEANFLQIASQQAKDVDLLAIIIYRGKSFGNLFNSVRHSFDKPIMLSEFGSDSYDAYREKEDQDIQSEFLISQWKDLYANTTISGNCEANAIGGSLFEWNDEWWKHNEGYSDGWSIHDTEAGWSHGAYFFDIRAKNNLNMNEEWFGIVSLSKDKENGINKRNPKKSYYDLRTFFGQPYTD
ncbi:MAG: hypothetical protein K9L86_02150 [Candidatus Omnitrophica bacterium]|nr:hypothetical protein [Candidatus Omnitrophota bacterium]